jgi:hypothetical protein
MNHTFSQIQQYTKMLHNLLGWFAKAEAHATTLKFDVNVLVNARLAPDQYPLVKQVQSTCDAAKFAAARLSGKEAPKHPDTEQTWDELKARVRSCLSWLETVKASDFADAETRLVELPFMDNKKVKGADYLRELSTPNFYFHLNHCYAILRHNGVQVGKMDYIGSITFA